MLTIDVEQIVVGAAERCLQRRPGDFDRHPQGHYHFAIA
jgi:hypothetical protein